MNLEIVDIIIGSVTLMIAGLSVLLTYRLGIKTIQLNKETRRINSLERKYAIAINNLETLYEIEKNYLPKELNQSHKQLQSDIRGWIKNNNLTLVRDNYNESFFQKERIFLNKN
ncbi:hypothetical protein N9766_04405 [Flavobacteriaceae bacterium]|nr:hypothetical protein [Flavobacteriaceae bacterium]|tara:strand:+ start:2691 stop:3032 length:342 start_codon:yes stop_codon:yes gene_type:complete